MKMNCSPLNVLTDFLSDVLHTPTSQPIASLSPNQESVALKLNVLIRSSWTPLPKLLQWTVSLPWSWPLCRNINYPMKQDKIMSVMHWQYFKLQFADSFWLSMCFKTYCLATTWVRAISQYFPSCYLTKYTYVQF